MPKKTKVLTDKYKSTTKIYPKVIMDSLTPEVREYIESQETKIDDTTTSATKVWSSQKTKQYVDGQLDDNVISNAKVWSSKKTQESLDKGIYYSNAAPTTVLTDTFYTSSQLENLNSLINFQVGDLIIRVDNSVAKEIYKITNIQSGTPQTLFVTKVAEFGGGGQSYQHNIFFHWQSGSYKVDVAFSIRNDVSSQMDYNSVLSYLNNKGLNTTEKVLNASGNIFVSGNYNIYGVYYSANNINVVGSENGAVQPMATGSSFISNWNDVVFPL